MTTTNDPIQKLISDTQAAEEPGDFQKGTYIQAPSSLADDQLQQDPQRTAGMVVGDLESAGWTRVYDTHSKECSLINNNALATQLSQRRSDGSPIFTINYPGEPWRGTYKCFLAEDQPEREMFKGMRFPVCKKTTMPNQYQADLHGKNRHRNEWAAWQQIRTDRKDADDRAAQRAMMEALTGAAIKDRAPKPPRSDAKIQEDRDRMAKVRSSIGKEE